MTLPERVNAVAIRCAGEPHPQRLGISPTAALFSLATMTGASILSRRGGGRYLAFRLFDRALCRLCGVVWLISAPPLLCQVMSLGKVAVGEWTVAVWRAQRARQESCQVSGSWRMRAAGLIWRRSAPQLICC